MILREDLIYKNNEEGDKIRKRRALIVEASKRMKASDALRLRKQMSINYYRLPVDWWERQKRLPDLNKLRKRRTLKATIAQRKVNVRKSFENMTSKRHALKKIIGLRQNGLVVTMKTFLERERNFLDEDVPYTTKIQCTPNRVYAIKLEFTNTYW